MPETRSAHPVFSSGKWMFSCAFSWKVARDHREKAGWRGTFLTTRDIVFSRGKTAVLPWAKSSAARTCFCGENDWLSRICLKSTWTTTCIALVSRRDHQKVESCVFPQENPIFRCDETRFVWHVLPRWKYMISVYDNQNAMQIPLRNSMNLMCVACDPELC